MTSIETTSGDVAAWWKLWALAALAHVLGNVNPGGLIDGSPRALSNVVVAGFAILLLVRPSDRWSRTALAVGLVVSVWFEAPRIGNHWLVAGMVAAAALVARPWRSDEQWWTQFAPTARVLLLVFYSFAAFAKLNAGFFDRSASCVRYFTNEMTGMGGIPEVPAGSVLVLVLAIVTVAVELSIPILLLLPATRRIGVATGVVFHSLIALDLVHHFFDFTAVLIALFSLFLAPGELARLADCLPTPGRRLRGLAWKLALLGGFAPGLTNVKAVGGLVVLVAYLVWLPLGVSIVRSVLVIPSHRVFLTLRPSSVGSAALIALAILNGLSPYLELKTATGFNMYANLRTGGGSTNHYLISRTAGLRSDADDLGVILRTDDEGLARYVDSGFALPLANLRDYLADAPEASVTFLVEGELVELDRAGDHPEWIDRMPWWQEKLATLRSVPIDDPPACQPLWLPAR